MDSERDSQPASPQKEHATEPSKEVSKMAKMTARLRSKWSYFLSLFGLSLGFFFYGYTLVGFNTIVEQLTEVFEWSESDKTLYSTIHSCMITGGNLVGSLAGPSISYRAGRHRFIIATVLVSALGVILTGIKNMPVIIIGRFIANLGSGVFQAVAPVIAFEMSPLEAHTFSSAFIPYQISVGVFISFLIGELPSSGSHLGEYWRFASLFPLIPCFIMILILVFVIKGDSGKFIYVKYKDEARAKKALERVYKPEEVEGELEAIKEEAKTVIPSESISQLFRRYKKQIGLGFAINFAQIGAGLTYIALYSNIMIDKIETKAGATRHDVETTIQLFAILCGVLELGGDSLSMLWLGKLKRKNVFLVIFGVSYSILGANWILGFANVLTAQKYLIIFSYFTFGSGVTQYLYIYAPAVLSDSAFGFVTGGFWAMSLVDSIIFPILIDSGLGINGTLVIYWVIGVIAVVYFMMAALEVKGLSSTQIFNHFNKGSLKKITPVKSPQGKALQTESAEKMVGDLEMRKILGTYPSNDGLVHVKTEPYSTEKDCKSSEGTGASDGTTSPPGTKIA